MKMIFIFIDGLGLGEADSRKNPLYAANAPHLRKLFTSDRMFPTETTLGVLGLPQSATGQTAIFTGVNAPCVLGRHLNAQPTATLIQLLRENNLFKELIRRGLRVTNANVYRQEYLEKMLDPAERRYRPSVTSVMAMSVGFQFRTVEDYNQGKGVYHDITGQIIVESGYEADIITPREAARRLYHISRDFDFTLYEHFLSDIIGHKMDMNLAVEEIELLDAFLGAVMEQMDPEEDIVIITSDHGNIEDATIKTHTMNRVPTVILGAVPEGVKLEVDSLLDIMPMVLRIFDKENHK